MIDVKELQDAVVTSLQALPDLTNALGGAGNITGYDPETNAYRTAEEAIKAMAEDTALVIFAGLVQTYRGEIQRWGYQFTVAMFCPGDVTAGTAGTHAGYFGLMKAIVDGIIPATQLRWYDSEIHPACDPPSDPRFVRALVDGSEVWHLTFSLIEIGG